MRLSRRDFIHAGCTAIAASLSASIVDKAEANARHGYIAPAPPNNNRVTINANGFYLNLAKGFGFPSQDPTTVSSDGYLLNEPSSSVTFSAPMPSNYYGQLVWKFNGAASMQFGPPAIIYSGGANVLNVTPSASGTTTVNTTISAALGSGPRVVLKFGALIASVSGGSGSLVTITTSQSLNFGSGFSTGSNISFFQGVSSNLSNGPNADGSWTITNVSATQFTLNGSTGVISPTVTGTGGVGVQSEAVLSPSGQNGFILNLGTFSSWGGLVFCRAADEAAITAGQIADSTYVSQLQYLFNQTGSNNSSRGWLRFMDLDAAQQTFECDFSQRIPSTYINYPGPGSKFYRPGYWTSGGTITNNGSDAYTCADPSISTWSGSAYIDNAIVQGVPSATNTGGVPTLNVGSHGAKPIFYYGIGATPFILRISAGTPSPGTDILQFTFTQASWASPQLNGGSPYVFSYPTTASGPFGSDGVQANLIANLETALVADATLAAALIFFTNSGAGGPQIYPRTAQAGRLTISYSSGPAIATVTTIVPSQIATGSGQTFIYNYLLDGWIYYPGGMAIGVPLEYAVDLCNRAGAHCWWNWGFTKGAFITAVTQFFGDATTGLASGFRFGNEPWNELWNSGAFPWPVLQALGNALGWMNTSFKSNYSYAGLRMIQYAALAVAAWTGKGRNASDYYVLQPSAGFDLTANGNFDTNQLKGALLVTSNATYATYGGLNGGTAPDHSTSPNRPVDITTATGCAPYWNSHWLGSGSFTTANQIGGTAAQNSPWLQAALDFANGNTSTAFTSMVNQFDGATARSGGSNTGSNFVDWAAAWTAQEALCAQYDSGRSVHLGIMHYEAGPSFGSGNDGNNGVNSLTFNTVKTVDINALASRMTALGWDVSPWTVSTTNNATEMATMVLQMLQAWKFDVTNAGVAANTSSYSNMIQTWYYQALKTISGANRETKPCQYGSPGSNWGDWPATIYDPNPYQSYLAKHQWNAGS